MLLVSLCRRRSEDNLGETEGALETQTRTLETLTRKVRLSSPLLSSASYRPVVQPAKSCSFLLLQVEELSSNTSEVAKLRDQLDESVPALLHRPVITLRASLI
jgi:hypothetical protein